VTDREYAVTDREYEELNRDAGLADDVAYLRGCLNLAPLTEREQQALAAADAAGRALEARVTNDWLTLRGDGG
jgi:hypothetical protein